MPSRRRKPPDDTPRRPGREPDNDEFVEDENSLRLHEAYLEYRVAGGAPGYPRGLPACRRAVRPAARRHPGQAGGRPIRAAPAGHAAG